MRKDFFVFPLDPSYCHFCLYLFLLCLKSVWISETIRPRNTKFKPLLTLKKNHGPDGGAVIMVLLNHFWTISPKTKTDFFPGFFRTSHIYPCRPPISIWLDFFLCDCHQIWAYVDLMSEWPCQIWRHLANSQCFSNIKTLNGHHFLAMSPILLKFCELHLCTKVCRHKTFLHFPFQWIAYEYKRLPFGYFLTPRTLSKCVDMALLPLWHWGMRFFFYLDDLIVMAHSKECAMFHTTHLILHLSKLGFTINWKKSALQLRQQVMYLFGLQLKQTLRATLSEEDR